MQTQVAELGPVSDSGFNENSEFVQPEMRETLGIPTKNPSQLLGNRLCEPNLLTGRFSSTNSDFLSSSSPPPEPEAAV